MDVEEERKLIELVKKGDNDALELLIDDLHYYIKNFLPSVSKPIWLTNDDLQQLVRIGLWQAIHKFDTSKKLRLWTYARYMIMNSIQHFCYIKKKDPPLYQHDDYNLLAENKIDKYEETKHVENEDLLEKVFQILEPKEQDLLKLLMKEKTHSEIAQIRKCTRQNIDRCVINLFNRIREAFPNIKLN